MTRCRASVPPNGDSCPNPATRLVVWKSARSADDHRPSDDKTPVCEDCVTRMREHMPGAIVRVETIVDDR